MSGGLPPTVARREKAFLLESGKLVFHFSTETVSIPEPAGELRDYPLQYALVRGRRAPIRNPPHKELRLLLLTTADKRTESGSARARRRAEPLLHSDAYYDYKASLCQTFSVFEISCFRGFHGEILTRRVFCVCVKNSLLFYRFFRLDNLYSHCENLQSASLC